MNIEIDTLPNKHFKLRLVSNHATIFSVPLTTKELEDLKKMVEYALSPPEMKDIF